MSTSEVRVRVLAWTLVLSFAGSHGIVGEADLFVEPVHIELSDKGSIVVVFEQLRNQCLCELILIEDDERVAVGSPANEVSVLAIVEKANSWLVSLWSPISLKVSILTCLISGRTAVSVFASPGQSSLPFVPSAPKLRCHHSRRCRVVGRCRLRSQPTADRLSRCKIDLGWQVDSWISE